MTPRRIQWSARQRYQGVKLSDLSDNRPVAVTRPGRWGNPFPVSDHGLDEALRLYRGWVRGDDEAVAEAQRLGWRYPLFHGRALVDEARRELAGRDLACACELTEECHAGILLRVANGEAP